MVFHNGPFGALFFLLCSLCRVLVDSLIVRGIRVVLYYRLYYYITINLYYTINTLTKIFNDFNDLGVLIQVQLYYAV